MLNEHKDSGETNENVDNPKTRTSANEQMVPVHESMTEMMITLKQIMRLSAFCAIIIICGYVRFKNSNIQTINQLISQSIDQSINRTIGQSINQTLSQSINQTLDQLINQTTDQSINQSYQTTDQSINQTTDQYSEFSDMRDNSQVHVILSYMTHVPMH